MSVQRRAGYSQYEVIRKPASSVSVFSKWIPFFLQLQNHRMTAGIPAIRSFRKEGSFPSCVSSFSSESFPRSLYLMAFACLIGQLQGFPGDSDGKTSACSPGDQSSIPGLGRSPGEGNGNPLQYSCLENSMDRGAWQATFHGVASSWTRLSDFTFFLSFFLSLTRREAVPIVAPNWNTISKKKKERICMDQETVSITGRH